MNEPRWLSSLSAVLLQLESLAEYGGSEGLRDEGLLESALARARNLYTYEGVTDKRAALMSIGLFLARNDHQLRADKADAARVMFGVASGEIAEEELTAWIREHVSALEERK